MELIPFAQQLKAKRQAYGVSQNKLAVAASMPRQYISSIESGHTVPSPEKRDYLMEVLEKYNPDVPFTMLFDYVRIRFPTIDIHHVIRDILRLKMEVMLHMEYGFYGYSEHYALGDIFVLISPEESKGVLLELKGRGCRQMESFLLAQHRSWYDFFFDCLSEQGVMKRLDLAINDGAGILNVADLIRKCEADECISVFRSFKSYCSGELLSKEEKPGKGMTLYIGSLSSEVYFCIYQKDYEQYAKYGISLEETPTKNRFEIRLKNDRAAHAVNDLLSYHDAEHTAFSIINRYLRFVDREDGKRRMDWAINPDWKRFLGENRERLKLTTQPEPYSFERTLNWLHRQVAPTLKMAMKLDRIKHTKIIEDMIAGARLTDRHKKLLMQQSMNLEDMIMEYGKGGE